MRTNQEPQEILTERPHDINNKVYEKIENLMKINNRYEIALIQTEYLIQKSLNPDETNKISDNLNYLYQALDICKNARINSKETRKKIVKTKLEQYIQNIEEFDSKYVTYKADGIKELFEDILKVLKN